MLELLGGLGRLRLRCRKTGAAWGCLGCLECLPGCLGLPGLPGLPGVFWLLWVASGCLLGNLGLGAAWGCFLGRL